MILRNGKIMRKNLLKYRRTDLDKKRNKKRNGKIIIGDRVILNDYPRTNLTENDIKKNIKIGAIGTVVMDMPTNINGLRYAIKFDIGITKGWFAADEIKILSHYRKKKNIIPLAS